MIMTSSKKRNIIRKVQQRQQRKDGEKKNKGPQKFDPPFDSDVMQRLFVSTKNAKHKLFETGHNTT